MFLTENREFDDEMDLNDSIELLLERAFCPDAHKYFGSTKSLEKRPADLTQAFCCTLGIDLKLNRDNEPFVIEVNGKESGINGIYQGGGKFVYGLRKVYRKEAIAECSDDVFSYLSAVRKELVDFLRRVENPRKYRKRVNKMPNRLEVMADDKIAMKSYVDPKYLAPFEIWDGKRRTIKRFIFELKAKHRNSLDLKRFPYVVAKGNHGAHGYDVQVFSMDEVEGIYAFLSQFEAGDALLEAFVESKPIGLHGDGCMRYLVDFMAFPSLEKGSDLGSGADLENKLQWYPFFEAAYWRISPGSYQSSTSPYKWGPLTHSSWPSLNYCYKANLTGDDPAIPVPVSGEDFDLAGSAVASTIKNIVNDGDLFSDVTP